MARNRNYSPRSVGKSFSSSVTKWISIATKREEFVIREILSTGLETAVETTPVDTGRARSSWRYSRTVPDHSHDQRPLLADPSNDGLLPLQRAKIRKEKMGFVHWITNNVPYAIPLEDGFSTKGGAMLRQAFGAILTKLPAIVARAKSRHR